MKRHLPHSRPMDDLLEQPMRQEWLIPSSLTRCWHWVLITRFGAGFLETGQMLLELRETICRPYMS